MLMGGAGGQKVKVVIAAAMWNNPHMLVLDEPTNYLDRESLGALAGAIKDYGGGVIMITHNSGEHSSVAPHAIQLPRIIVRGAVLLSACPGPPKMFGGEGVFIGDVADRRVFVSALPRDLEGRKWCSGNYWPE